MTVALSSVSITWTLSVKTSHLLLTWLDVLSHASGAVVNASATWGHLTPLGLSRLPFSGQVWTWRGQPSDPGPVTAPHQSSWI